MKRIASLLLLSVLLTGLAMMKTDRQKAPDSRAPVTAIRGAAMAFLGSLSPELKKQVTFSLDHPERRKWSNLPATMFKREGVSFKEMSPAQRSLAHQLIQSTLSSQG